MDDTDRALLDALDSTIKAGQRLTTLAERLLTRAARGPLLAEQEREDATNELATAAAGFEQPHSHALLMGQAPGSVIREGARRRDYEVVPAAAVTSMIIALSPARDTSGSPFQRIGALQFARNESFDNSR